MNHLKMACNHTMNSTMNSTMKMDMSMMDMKSNHLQYSNTNQRTSTTGTTATATTTTTNGNDILSIRTKYLAGLPQGPTVNY